MWGPRSIIQGKAKNFGDIYEITLHYIWGQRSKVNYPKYLKQKISVTSMKLHFITFEVKGPWSISKVNYPKYLKQKILVTSMKLHFITFEVKENFQGQLSKVSKAKNFGDIYEITLHYIWGQRSMVNFQGQLSKVSKAKNFGDLYEITLHYIWGQRSKVNYPKYLKQKISVTSIFMKIHFKQHKK